MAKFAGALLSRATSGASRRNHRRGPLGVFVLAMVCSCAVRNLLPSVAAFVPGSSLAANAFAAKAGSRWDLARQTTVAAAATEFTSEKEKEDFRYLTLTFLQRVQSDEDDVKEACGEKGSMDYKAFCGLLTKLELDPSEVEKDRLFKMIDDDNSGQIEKKELRVKLRDSDAINEMYAEGLTNVGVTVASALALAGIVALIKGPGDGLDFLTAYVVEDSLSVDNLFVFLLLFQYFKVPPNLQSYCLNVGIWGAVILRGLFIFLGLQAIETFRPLLLFFAAFLIYASYQGLAADDDDDDDEEEVPEFVANIQKQLPTTDKFDGEKLWVQNEKGETLVTPLATCIIAVELCDVLFAVDSIPAVFAVTSDPLVVFGSNIAAILGLRSLYQVLSVAAQDLVYLEKAVAVVLGFVGVKLGLEVFGIEVSSVLSLGVIVVTLGVGIAASIYEQNKDEYGAMIKKIPVSNFQKLIKGLGDIGK